MLLTTSYNPDVLTCLANLSSDEVFTHPNLANQILDLLPEELWRDKNARFLDPVCKTGVFLREIAKRLMVGLETAIPDPEQRANHIYKNQLYGLALTELTGLLARRSVYCSKTANGKYSVCDTFNDEQGNIRFNLVQHTWRNGRCLYCGANQEVYGRGDEFETYAYQFIHTNEPEKFFINMRFDVIIGNPPYQLSDGGFEKSATPIYNKFVEQAIKLNPRYLTMIIPARWYSGGKGLEEFRNKMLKDGRISVIHDYPETSDCFPGLNIRGGVCYFLWDKEHKGNCKVTNHKADEVDNTVVRPLLESGNEVFIRYNKAISILRKVQNFKELSFSKYVSSHKAFGLRTYVKGKSEPFTGSIKLYQNGGIGYVSESEVIKNSSWISEYKVIVPYASPGNDTYPHQILSKPIISEPNSCCTETYLVVGPFANKNRCESVSQYMRTKFVRFLILLLKPSQHVTQKTYDFVPDQNFDEFWTDEKLYGKYGITEEESNFIDTLIRPME